MIPLDQPDTGGKENKTMGKSYVVKGEALPRNYQPKKGDRLFIEGRKATIKTVIAANEGIRPEYVYFVRAVDGTTGMSTANLRMVARLAVSNG